MSIQHFGKGVLRGAKNYAKGYSDVQAKVREATSNDPWGPSGTQMNDIAELTFNQNDFVDIVELLDKRLNDQGKNWRHVFKSLTLLDYCLHAGSENVVIYFRDNLYVIKTLKEFQYIDKYGRDQGANVRQKAKDITNLLSDDTRLREERMSRARRLQDRMASQAAPPPTPNNGSPSIVTPPTCPNCKSRQVAPNPATGQHFDYCSKACATQAKNLGLNTKGGKALALCEQCKRRPRFVQGTTVHPYCGRVCAQLAANNGSAPANLPANPQIPGGAHLAPLQQASSGLTCQISGCTLPAFVHPDGTLNTYCMVTHIDWGEHGCVSCRAAAMTDASVLCQPCHDGALSKAPVIIQVLEDHKNYKSVEKQFKQSWRHNTTCPEIKAVYKIIVTEASMNQYQEYIDDVEARGNFVALGKPRGNEHRRWHGTKRKCNIGDPGNNTFCTDSDCPLCCIIQSSFDLRFFKAATGWGRFGHGIYTSSTSSKSNDYSKNIGVDSEWKALLLNKVVVGNGKKLIQDDTSLTEPPMGFDSVLAEVAPGGALNYDELVVYRNEAVRPSYLVMYQSP